jgi:hypothetical protein
MLALMGSHKLPEVFVVKYNLTFKRRSADCFTYRPSPYRAVNSFQLGYKNQSVYAVSGTSRCLFSDKYKTHKHSMGRAYSCQDIQLVGASRNQ